MNIFEQTYNKIMKSLITEARLVNTLDMIFYDKQYKVIDKRPCLKKPKRKDAIPDQIVNFAPNAADVTSNPDEYKNFKTNLEFTKDYYLSTFNRITGDDQRQKINRCVAIEVRDSKNNQIYASAVKKFISKGSTLYKWEWFYGHDVNYVQSELRNEYGEGESSDDDIAADKLKPRKFDYELHVKDEDGVETYVVPFVPIGEYSMSNTTWNLIDNHEVADFKRRTALSFYRGWLRDCLKNTLNSMIIVSKKLDSKPDDTPLPRTEIDGDFGYTYDSYELWRVPRGSEGLTECLCYGDVEDTINERSYPSFGKPQKAPAASKEEPKKKNMPQGLEALDNFTF